MPIFSLTARTRARVLTLSQTGSISIPASAIRISNSSLTALPFSRRSMSSAARTSGTILWYDAYGCSGEQIITSLSFR